ncbi:hypothetical protein FFI94_033095 [Rhodococcus sp. KBS0724]|uniref:hypothetical protein n=1 Tax=Rhodococcus sp. KBS0724 TaxID=1179674 RepID=UPI00110D8199|nr:hypothetical protein [Rhodococcus sp. KBS0724]TSD40524.1 hypothetical protein FFI94_033095 [Rhodococcus sp. KBS0724]
MKPAISRRDMYEWVIHHMTDMGFERVSTRRGKTDDLFHIDGKGVVGRGTVQTDPVSGWQLQTVYKDVYVKKAKDRWIHFAWGGYTKEAQSFANATNIALFEFQNDGPISPASKRAAAMYRRKPSERWKTQAIWAVVVLAAVAALVGVLVLFPAVRWVLGVIAVVLVLSVVFKILELTNPQLFR